MHFSFSSDHRCQIDSDVFEGFVGHSQLVDDVQDTREHTQFIGQLPAFIHPLSADFFTASKLYTKIVLTFSVRKLYIIIHVSADFFTASKLYTKIVLTFSVRKLYIIIHVSTDFFTASKLYTKIVLTFSVRKLYIIIHVSTDFFTASKLHTKIVLTFSAKHYI